MFFEKISLGLVVFGLFFSTIALGETYRCVNSKGMFEYTNIPCTSDGALAPAPAIPSATKVESGIASKRSNGGSCTMQLAPQPTPSGVKHSYAEELDHLEERLYKDARSGRIHWVQLVDTFYARCAELYPSNDVNDREISAYQRTLAEQMDARSITESEWVYLQEKNLAERRARNQLIENTRPRPIIINNPSPIIVNNPPPIFQQDTRPRSTNCTTREFMGTYRTSCD